MSALDFQLIDDEKIDDSSIKREFIKISHQSGANGSSENSSNQFFFEENYNFIQVGKRYLEFDNKNWKVDFNNFSDGDVLRLVNSAFAYTINDARIYSSSGVEIEQNKVVGPISTIMRLNTQKDGDLSTYFDIND